MEQARRILLVVSISSLLLSSLSAEATSLPKDITNPRIRSSEREHPLSRSRPRVSVPSHSAVTGLPSIPIPAIKSICHSTDYPALCISSLAPYLISKSNPAAVLEAAIKACVNYTNIAIAEAQRLSSKPTYSSMAKSYIKDCQDHYVDAIDNFRSATSAISTMDVGTLNSMLSGAISDVQTCEDGFAEMYGMDSPLKKMDEKLTRMTSNCLAIASLIR